VAVVTTTLLILGKHVKKLYDRNFYYWVENEKYLIVLSLSFL